MRRLHPLASQILSERMLDIERGHPAGVLMQWIALSPEVDRLESVVFDVNSMRFEEAEE